MPSASQDIGWCQEGPCLPPFNESLHVPTQTAKSQNFTEESLQFVLTPAFFHFPSWIFTVFADFCSGWHL